MLGVESQENNPQQEGDLGAGTEHPKLHISILQDLAPQRRNVGRMQWRMQQVEGAGGMWVYS